MSTGKIEIEIERAYEGGRWLWDIWVDGSPYNSDIVDTLKEATDGVLESLEGKQ